jgi:hypothetical protein
MGFLDKMKGFANKITGGAATVSLTVMSSNIKEPIKIRVQAITKDTPLEIKKVYLYVKSVEEVSVPRHELPAYGNATPVQALHLDEEIFKQQEFTVAPAQTLAAGQSYEWFFDLNLPQGANVSYIGKYVRHQWFFLAALDASGNDPDSGWQVANLM